MLKVWKGSPSGLQMVHSQKLNFGELQCVKFSPDSGPVVAVGGSKEELVKVISLDSFEAVKTTFSP